MMSPKVKTVQSTAVGVGLICILFWLIFEPTTLVFTEEYLQEQLQSNPFFLQADNITGFPDYVVPNIIHFIRLQLPYVSFLDLVTMLAAHKHQNPDKIYVHCDDCRLYGPYWKKALETIPEIQLMPLELPEKVFGRNIAHIWHAGDIARIKVLQKYGGIFLDNDVYVIQSLDHFRKFEMTLGWEDVDYMGTQVLIAHPQARFLKLWYECYRNYHGHIWYYNAGALPTTAILYRHPEVIHRVKVLFGVDLALKRWMYDEDNSEWRSLYTIHFLSRHRIQRDGEPPQLNETTIRTYNRTFGRMARLVYYGTEDLLPS